MWPQLCNLSGMQELKPEFLISLESETRREKSWRNEEFLVLW
jgi:hypothetical protein